MLKVNQHILATHFPVNSSATILEGQVVTLNSSGEVILADKDVHTWAIGIAGDAKSTLTAGQFVNRLSDSGDETNASGRITVYHGVGTELYLDTTDAITGTTPSVGDILYVSATAGKLQDSAPGGNDIQVARVIGAAAYLDTGIPNVNTPATDSDSPRTFVLVSLLI